MQLPLLLIGLLGALHYAEAGGKTHIYIDQIPLYTKLATCAEERISAIVRAQASGCGDDTQLTSFACFCIDSSSEFASIISTAVEEECSRAATETAVTARHAVQTPVNRVMARATTRPAAATRTGAVAKNVNSALEAFDSYCAKSTELSRFEQSSTAPVTESPKTVFITTPSSASTADASQSKEKKDTPIAAIVVPVILIPLALGIALWFFLKYRRQQKQLVELQANTLYINGPPIPIADRKELATEYSGNEMYAVEHRAEMPQNQRHFVELDVGVGPAMQKHEKHGII